MPTTLENAPAQLRATRPLYLKKVPTPVWERLHVNAIRSGMRLSDYLVTVLATAEPLATGQSPHAHPILAPSGTSSPANGNG